MDGVLDEAQVFGLCAVLRKKKLECQITPHTNGIMRNEVETPGFLACQWMKVLHLPFRDTLPLR
jgi:hypothetical protein